MDVYQAIFARQTIRDFAPQPVEEVLIQKIIAAGFAAPSSNHLREWHFVLLNDRTKRTDLLDRVIHPVGEKGSAATLNHLDMTDADRLALYIDAIPQQYSMLLDAGCLLLPFFFQPSPLLKPKTISALNAFASIWTCIENILIAAASEGIFGVPRIPDAGEAAVVKEFLHVPAGFEFLCWIALGYPAQGAKRAAQFPIDPATRIHHETW